MATLEKAPTSNFWSTSLNGAINNSVTTITLNSTTGLQSPGRLVLSRQDSAGTNTASAREVISFTGISGSDITGVTRGADNSTARSHADGALVESTVLIGNWSTLYSVIDEEHNTDGTHDAAIVATLTGTQTLTNKTLTSPTINGTTTYDTAAQASITAISPSTVFMPRQAIINGNFDVWQRGTSVALTAADGYTADRWYVETATAGTDKTISRQDGTGVPGSYYCARVAIVQDVDELLTFSQALESQDSIKFRGQKVTLSFYARGGAEFVADNATLVSKIVTGKGTDQKVLAFTTSADGVSQNNTLTTGWVKFTCTTTAAIAADITQIGVSFAFTHAGSGTTTNYFEITQVQLCAGDVALPFQPKSFEEELRACQRYYYKTPGTAATRIAGGYVVSTTTAAVFNPFPVNMRIDPSTLEQDGTATDYSVAHANTITNCSSVPTFNSANYAGAVTILTVASGLTVGQGCLGRIVNAAGYLAWSAEL